MYIFLTLEFSLLYHLWSTNSFDTVQGRLKMVLRLILLYFATLFSPHPTPSIYNLALMYANRLERGFVRDDSRSKTRQGSVLLSDIITKIEGKNGQYYCLVILMNVILPSLEMPWQYTLKYFVKVYVIRVLLLLKQVSKWPAYVMAIAKCYQKHTWLCNRYGVFELFVYIEKSSCAPDFVLLTTL